MELPLCRFLMLQKTEKRMRSYFGLVDFWGAAASYFGFRCVNCSQGFTVLPFHGGERRLRHTWAAVLLPRRYCSGRAEDAIDCPRCGCHRVPPRCRGVAGEWPWGVSSPAGFNTMTPSPTLFLKACARQEGSLMAQGFRHRDPSPAPSWVCCVFWVRGAVPVTGATWQEPVQAVLRDRAVFGDRIFGQVAAGSLSDLFFL